MSFQNIVLSIVFLFVCVNVSGQQTLIIPQNFDNALNQKKQVEVNLVVYPYVGSNIDVRDMKMKYPLLKVDDFVTIIPPDLSAYNTVSTLMTVVQDPESDKLALVIWLAGDYDTNDVTFLIDRNSSRSFIDAQKIKLKGGGKAKEVNLFPFGRTGRSAIKMFIKVPKKSEDELAGMIKTRKKSKQRIYNSFAIGATVGFGSGNVHHDYISTTTNFPGWYDVVLSEKLLGLTATKYFKSFKIEARGTYQNIFQYTSYFKLRYGEPEITFTDSGVRVVKENLRVDTNQDRHTRHRLKLGMLAAPRIKVGKLMEFQPSIGGGYIFFLNDPYLANKFEGNIKSFEQEKTPYLELGLNVEMTVGNKRSFSLGFFYNAIDWKPIGYFESIEGTSFTNTYRGYNLTLGYTYGL